MTSGLQHADLLHDLNPSSTAGCAPVCLFAYNRPEHTLKTLNALAQNQLAAATPLVVFCDGAKIPGHEDAVREVRSIARKAAGFRSVHVVERDRNFGLAPNIIDGVTAVVQLAGRVIVLEDDLVTEPGFLTYMNAGLDAYEHAEEVASIHGYVYPIEGLPEYFFLRGADCWGWATWKRAWELFDPDGTRLLRELRKQHLERDFDFDFQARYMRMLQDQIAGKNNSWAVRWYASAFLAGKLTLYPGRSFVTNIGFDWTGEHSSDAAIYRPILHTGFDSFAGLPHLEESVEARKKFAQFFKQHRTPVLQRIRYFLRKKILR